jgi:3-hydroxybutyryl-CoA dehydrogenase
MDNIRQVCVVGAGAMGRQIALSTAIHGYEVRLYDVSREALEDARTWANEYLAGRVAKGRLSQAQVDQARARLHIEPELRQAVVDADLVIEAATERLDLKRQLFADLDRLCKPSAILATNSSTIVSSKLADATQRPDRIANLHYFNPALVMELVEVVQGPHTSEQTVEALLEFARRTGKTPIRLRKEVFGFVANRLLHALANEAIYLYENGYASFEEIDLAAEKALGHPMGPFRLMDLTGIDVAYFVRQQKYLETGREEDKPARSIVERYERGDFGRKTGRGWYDYTQPAEAKAPEPDGKKLARAAAEAPARAAAPDAEASFGTHGAGEMGESTGGIGDGAGGAVADSGPTETSLGTHGAGELGEVS